MADHPHKKRPLPIRKPNADEQRILEKAMKTARRARDRAVNRQKKPSSSPATKPVGSHIPTLRRTRRDIMNELT